MTGENPYSALQQVLKQWQDEKAADAGESSDLEEQTLAAIEWLRAKWGEEKPCPWCGNTSYYVLPPEPLALPDGGQTPPYISVVCRNCGQTTRIDLRIFDPGESVAFKPSDSS